MAENNNFEEVIAKGLSRRKMEKQQSDFEYYRVREHFGKLERGTIFVDGLLIPSYPHIKRIFTLEKGLLKNIGDDVEIYVEEKIDGFNVRIALIRNKVCAFSRGGFLDLFVTEKLAEEPGLAKFFKENPGYIVCGEMIGNTPHTSPTKEFDTKFFVFDIANPDGTLIGTKERYKILKKYGILGVPLLGKMKSSDFARLKKIILRLNKEKKEGMVIKTADRTKVVKYVTAFSDIQDIAQSSEQFFDMPLGFYYQRILRSAIFVDDFGFDRKKFFTMLGKAFYEGLINSIKNAKSGKDISEEFEISIKDERIWGDILHHMGKEVRVEEIWRKKEPQGDGKGGSAAKTRIRFRKIYRETSKKLKSYLGGKGIAD
ncbi:RNA ligase [Candidatus Micrarchaeota archaeon]|nr:RNA ligase [Candidatus Micrarchaeota archaeon]